MGKKNSKLKQDTIDRLTTDTYCKYYCIDEFFSSIHSDCKKNKLSSFSSHHFLCYRNIFFFIFCCFQFHFLVVDSIEYDYRYIVMCCHLDMAFSFDSSHFFLTINIPLHHLYSHMLPFTKPYSSHL